jgi:hypothetical protein
MADTKFKLRALAPREYKGEMFTEIGYEYVGENGKPGWKRAANVRVAQLPSLIRDLNAIVAKS